MIAPSDKDYQETKQIMLGEATMKKEFADLAKWIDKTYGVRTVNIYYDVMNHNERPRLEVIFESEEESNSFRDWNLNFDEEKQKQIAKKFRETLIGQGLFNRKNVFNFWRTNKKIKYNPENIFVYFSAFKPVAKEEVFSKVSQSDIKKLMQELNNQDLWTIQLAFTTATFFVITDEQVKQYENSKAKKVWSEKLFDLLKPHDVFNYFDRETFNIVLDSKENFDANYKSSWLYYYR